jgi:hypothetical protein
MTKQVLLDHELNYFGCNRVCASRRRKLGLTVPDNERDIELLICNTEPCFPFCPNW